ERVGARLGPHHAVLGAVAAPQVPGDGARHRRVVVDGQQHRLHGRTTGHVTTVRSAPAVVCGDAAAGDVASRAATPSTNACTAERVRTPLRDAPAARCRRSCRADRSAPAGRRIRSPLKAPARRAATALPCGPGTARTRT